MGRSRPATSAGHVLLVGCGALGSVIADALVRAGVGRLTIVDRDVVERTNLHRQVLFTEADARAMLPKAEAARRRLAEVNADVTLETHIADFTGANARQLAERVDVLVDGTDNFSTRLLLNDLAVERGVPYVYGGAVGTTGTWMTILPATPGGDTPWEQAGGATPCLRCLLGGEPSDVGETCDTVGVLGPLAGIVALHEATQTIKCLLGRYDRVDRRMGSLDVWANEQHATDMHAARDEQCPCCARRRFDYLDGTRGHDTVALCGRDAVQFPAPSARPDLAALAERLRALGEVTSNAFMLRAGLPFQGRTVTLSVFADGRAIVQGAGDVAAARAACARYLGR